MLAKCPTCEAATRKKMCGKSGLVVSLVSSMCVLKFKAKHQIACGSVTIGNSVTSLMRPQLGSMLHGDAGTIEPARASSRARIVRGNEESMAHRSAN